MDVIRVTDQLDPHEVLEGYRKGIFPMGYTDAPVYSWHLPDHRGVLPLDGFHVSRSFARTLSRLCQSTVTLARSWAVSSWAICASTSSPSSRTEASLQASAS